MFRARGVEPAGYVLPAYAAVERARSARAAPVAAALRAGRYPTVLGELAFDRKGDLREDPFIVRVWRDGRRVPAGG